MQVILQMLKKIFSLFLLLILPIGLTSRSIASDMSRVHPWLIQMAEEDPDQRVSVIIQKGDDSGTVEELVKESGGVITLDLPIIHAFAAEMAASTAVKLASSPTVHRVSPDARLQENRCLRCPNSDSPPNVYLSAIGVDHIRNENPSLTGQGVTVAVVDSGIAFHDDLGNGDAGKQSWRVIADYAMPNDQYGHGTHVAGVIGGNGFRSDGLYTGVTPEVNLVNVRVTDNKGMATTSRLIAGLNWIFEHREDYNIRVVNLSLTSTIPESYHTSPLDAALEILWFNGIVVVVSAGNVADDGMLHPPANDPFVITVGATDDQGTPDTIDDVLASYSLQGITLEGFAKPDLVAPGNNIVSLLSSPHSRLSREHPDHLVNQYYFRMSGTSMASAVTSGAVALLLQDEPELNPDQVKYRLMTTARDLSGSDAGYLDIYAAVNGTSLETANIGLPASQLLWSGSDPIQWGSVNWGSVNWGSVNWGSVNWGAVNWGTVNWSSVYWEP